ncbi:tbc1 domain family member 4-like [Limosa lapponica baueri]|uniref:Tbc1 domain family member 4-like n=1 Tax=Limosa lapponica baueri TaxID=1758121 RepID=A0A2I0TEM6_LIMLA|nr:tbc1 domain family member 4-like [Limosa lapponica baueri]
MTHVQTLILIGDFNRLDIYWKSSTVNCKQSRRLLECIEDNFLVQLVFPLILLKYVITEALSPSQTGLALASGGSVMEPAGIGSI